MFKNTKVTGQVSGCHEGSADRWLLEVGVFLEHSQRAEELGEGTISQRTSGILKFVFQELVEPLLVVDILSFASEQNIVAVEGDAQFVAGIDGEW